MSKLWAGVLMSVTSVVFAAGIATATEIKYAGVAPAASPMGGNQIEVGKNAEAASGGELKIEYLFGGVLGDEQTVMRQVVRGRVDMSASSGTATSLIVPEYALLSAPYLFDNDEQADCFIDNYAGEIFGPLLKDAGLVLLGFTDGGQSAIFSTVDINRPADMANLKLRIPPGLSSTALYETLGVASVPMGVADMVPALNTGQVKGIVTSVTFGLIIGLPKAAPKIIGLGATRDFATITMSLKTWEKLSDGEREALLAANKNPAAQRAVLRDDLKVRMDKAVADGASLSVPSGEDAAAFRAVGEKAQALLREKIGPTADAVWEKILAGKNACQK